MSAKELFDYYNTSKAHEHLSCSIEVVESFLNEYPEVKNMSLEEIAKITYENAMRIFNI